jgi:hypothetical protein
MTQVIRSNFQSHPFHLVSPSPWPMYTSFSLFSLTASGALSMHSFDSAYIVFFVALLTLVSSMSLWFRDIISEGKPKINSYILNIARAISIDNINDRLIQYKNNNNITIFNQDNDLGHYLAGLLEGDGHISLPSLGNTTLNRVLNPRIIFTSHKNNLGMYAFLQSELGNIGRFQLSGDNIIRYIIGDIKGIIHIINLIHGKLRTPKNKRFNDLIKFINAKYNLNIPESNLNDSNYFDNSWFTGFTEADGHFGIKYVEKKEKSETRNRSTSLNISLRFRLDQRAYDKSTSSSMKPFMEELALCLSCNLNTYKNKTVEVLSLSVSALDNIKIIMNYFDKYPLIGDKLNDYDKWKIVYKMILLKEHLSEDGRLKIKTLINKI